MTIRTARIAEEKNFDFHPNTLERVDQTDLGFLARLLSHWPREDGYSVSPSYYAMTGRNGLWRYSNGGSFLLIAAHPNAAGHLLLFPPMGAEPSRLLKEAVQDPRLSAHKIQLARMSAQDHLILTWAQASGYFAVRTEKLLDWKYPVQTYSTRRIVEHAGRQFRNFRHGVNLARDRNLTARLATTSDDRQTIVKLTDAWVQEKSTQNDMNDVMTTPARKLVSLMAETDLPLHAIIVHEGDTPVGFLIWEETSAPTGLANALCGMSTAGKGTHEFTYLSMAQILQRRGFDHICDGGSETKGLDAFKRKMNPVKSVPLQSAFSIHP